MSKLVIILDPAHGEEVPGKRSPDGKHREYKWSRNICNRVAEELVQRDIKVVFTNLTEKEIGLSKRKNFANSLEIKEGEIKFLVSIHNNAAGNGDNWMQARGFEIYTSKGQTLSDKFASIIFQGLRDDFPNFEARMNTSDGDEDKEENFTVLMGNYPAVLLEWLFQDNQQDVELLANEKTNELLVKSLVGSLLYINHNLDSLI